jgi:hypothetical protein
MSDQHPYITLLSNWLQDNTKSFKKLSTEFNVCPLHETQVTEKTHLHECQCKKPIALPDWKQTKSLSELVQEWEEYLETMSTKEDLITERTKWLKCYFKAYEMNNDVIQKMNQEPEKDKSELDMTDATIDEQQYEINNFLSKTRVLRYQDYIPNYCFMHHKVVNGFSTRHVSFYNLECFICPREDDDDEKVQPITKFQRI